MRPNPSTPATPDLLATAAALTDHGLLARIQTLATTERGATAELVAHLAVLETRPKAYRAEGHGSLFAYCTAALHLSEDAACSRIDAARLSRSYPLILDLLADGSVTLTAIRMLKQHLTQENHATVLGRAAHRRKEEIEALIAEIAPKPDVASTVRKLPTPSLLDSDSSVARGEASVALSTAAATPCHAHRSVVQALSPQRYRVQFTIGEESQDRLRRLRTLLCRDIPGGDAGAIFERALAVLLEKVEREKLGAPARQARDAREAGGRQTYETRIRSGTDFHSRHIPTQVRRQVWFRDRGQCAFVSRTGRRCGECRFLEFHHIHPYALNGPPTIANISLRCRGHNQYEGERVFGPRGPSNQEPA